MKFTKNQQKAIDVNGGNYLVAAAAGSGKTAVLANRVVRLLTEGDDSDDYVKFDEILVLTFTNASTFEMRERIGRILSQKIAEQKSKYSVIEDEDDKILIKNKILFYESQKLKLPNAKISTIDSLCSNLVKENFQSLGISSSMRTANGVELDLLKSQIADDVLEDFYDKDNNADFLNLVETFGFKDDSSLKEMIISGYKFIRSFPYPFDYLEKSLDNYENFDEKTNSMYQIIPNLIIKDVDLCIKLLTNALDLSQTYGEDDNLYINYGDNLTNELEAFDKVKSELNLKKYDKAINNLKSIKFVRAGSKVVTDKETLASCIALRNKVKKITENLTKRYCEIFDNLEADIKNQFNITKIYFELLREYYNRLQDKKRELEIMDFSDISFYTLDLLSQKDVDGKYVQSVLAKALSDQIKYIVVDECQDISKVQNQIFNLLSKNEENIYMVGDVKQSIYGFRDASPEIFIEKKFNKNKTETILLKDNFRSRDVVCDIVNYIFSQLMSSEIGDIDYNENEELVCGRSDYFEYPDAIPELHIIDKTPSDENSSKVIEANHVAQTIKDMIDNKYQVVGQDGNRRDCDYKDFAVLSRSSKLDAYVDALEQLGIPADSEIKTDFFTDRDVSVSFNLLKIINNPLDDIALTSVLMSPLFGFSPDLISKIKLNTEKGKLWVGLYKLGNLPEITEDDTIKIEYDENCKEVCNLIEIFRRKASSLSTTKLLQYVYDKTDFLALMSTQCDVSKIDLNMQLFLNYTKEYESFSNNGLAGFISYVAKLKELKKDFDGITPQINESNSVKLITIHKSKGLEYPICFLVNCDKGFNKQDIKSADYLWDNTLGFATKVVDHDRRYKYTTLPYETIRLKKDKDGVSEELRVLYVALTRAKEKLIMVGTMKSSSKVKKSKKNGDSIVITYVKDKVVEILNLINYPIVPEDVFEINKFLNWLIISLLGEASFKDFNENKKYMIDEVIDGKVRFRIINSIFISDRANKLSEELNEKSVELSETNIELDYKLIETIQKQLDTKYENQELTTTPIKSTVTKIAKANFAKDSKIPIKLNSNLLFNNVKDKDFVQQVTPAQRGNILHTFMQYANFENAIDNLDDEIQNLIDNKFLSQVQVQHLDKDSIQSFLKSTTYIDRMAKEGNKIKREFKFNFFIPANLVNENLGADDKNKIFIQGIADCLVFDKDGNITILDYKTDAIRDYEKADDNKNYRKRLSEQYKQQMILYAKALNDIYGEGKVIDAYLYSLAIAEEIQISI